MRMLVALMLSLAAAAPLFAQEATPAAPVAGASQAFVAPAPQPQPPRADRRFRRLRAAARVVREVHAQVGLPLPSPRAAFENEIVAGAAVGLGLGGLAFQDCDSRVSPCAAAIILSSGVGAMAGAIVRHDRKH